MRNILHLWISMLVLTFILSCEQEYFSPIEDDLAAVTENSQDKPGKATGEVLVILETPEGGEHGMGGPDMGNRPEGERNALFSFNAHEATLSKNAKGSIHLAIYRSEEIKREISAEVYDVQIDGNEAYFTAVIVDDTKPCDGSPGGPGGHSGGCSEDHDDGGCSGHDSGTDEHDGGCSGHDTGTDEHDGGCSGHDTGTDEHDGGCSGHDTGTDEHDGGCSGGHGSGDSGHGSGSDGEHPGPSGKYCRTGQFMVVYVYDGGSPGVPNDEIKWKWFGKKRNFPKVDEIENWGTFCAKSIIDGNIVVH